MHFLSWDIIQQVIRYAMQIIGALLIKDSVEGAQYWEAATAGLINIAGAVWWWYAQRKAAVVTRAAGLDGVTVQVSKSESPSTAAATKNVDGVKVTP